MLIKKAADVRSSEVTPKSLYLNRRSFLAGAAAVGAAAATGIGLREVVTPSATVLAGNKIDGIKKSSFSTTETITPYKDVTHYNNYYEFSTEKDEPAELAKNFRTHPWKVKIDGLVEKKQELDIDTILKMAPPEERIYRHRCVERWSIVVPWVGFSLSELIKRVNPLGKAKFVEFTTILDMTQMPGQKRNVLEWPYVEGLRMDEAMHPLALLCFGMYGEDLPNQDGAPLRLIVPWKYGFKSAKAIVRIRFTDKQPVNTWNISAPREYGFYSNVNPTVDHPRWSQAKERRLGEFLMRPTLMFNGYGDQVASLYSGMDLRKDF
ncbi:MAG TPA: protein-methionine-sulfoxide reductase catalytic subunit MsrP [Candidatus Sulfotelmatobacter sp.]|jgi:sulfoxide reductase catalytic subunit YedY|nr:protein-methionine-sulfoxide reductase catalytic subunit MsrP [Candidatus Sulfotelmatobacter sp.]